MTHLHRITAASVLTAALLAAGCTSTPPGRDASAFQPGRYQNGDTVAVFNSDGTFVGTTTTGDDWVRGTYQLRGNEVVMRDTWESDALRQEMGTDCIGIPGRYSWTLADDVLIATVIDDPCAGRRQGTSGVRWTRMR